jgi:DNA modification methylase
MNPDGQYQLVFGDGSNMSIVRNREADMVLTSPPYFPEEVAALMEKPLGEQTELMAVRTAVTSFALGLRSVYEEARRILRPGGVLVVQIKDIRYGGVLVPLASIHRDMVESTGLVLLTRVFWHKFNRRSRSHRFPDNPVVGAFRADEVEEIMVFSDQDIEPQSEAPVELDAAEIRLCTSPLWTMAPAGRRREHPHKAPSALVRRMIALFSKPGDLVVDPFAGSGTTLEIAVKMGRRAVGYEIEERYARLADISVGRKIGINPKHEDDGLD